MHRLWTFQVIGPQPVAVQPPGNPVASHNGGTSVFHLMLTDEQMQEVSRIFEDAGNKVKCWPAATQTDEQRAERLRLLGAGRTEEDFPSPLCPMCFWFDPHTKGLCGRGGWEEGLISACLEAHEIARDAEKNCPVREW